MAGLMSGLFHRSAAGVETPVAIENAVDDEEVIAASAGTLATPPMANQGSRAETADELAALKAQLAESERKTADRDAKIQALEAKDRQTVAERLAERVTAIKADGKAFAAGLVAGKQLMPPGADAVASLHAYAHLSAAGLTTEGIDPVASIKGLVAGLVPHSLTSEAITDAAADSAGVFRVENGSAGASDQPSESRVNHLLDKHPGGATALAARTKSK